MSDSRTAPGLPRWRRFSRGACGRSLEAAISLAQFTMMAREQNRLDMLYANFRKMIEDATVAEIDEKGRVPVLDQVDVAGVGPLEQFGEFFWRDGNEAQGSDRPAAELIQSRWRKGAEEAVVLSCQPCWLVRVCARIASDRRASDIMITDCHALPPLSRSTGGREQTLTTQAIVKPAENYRTMPSLARPSDAFFLVWALPGPMADKNSRRIFPGLGPVLSTVEGPEFLQPERNCTRRLLLLPEN